MVKAIEGRGAADLAKRALENVGQIFRYAIAHGYAKRNPASEIRPADVLRPTHKTNLARIDAKDLPALLRAIEVYQGTHITRLAMKLLALTFVRTSELIGASSRFGILKARFVRISTDYRLTLVLTATRPRDSDLRRCSVGVRNG